MVMEEMFDHSSIAEAVVAGVAGLLLGGHATVLAHRVPAKEKILVTGCRCPNCDAQLRLWDQIPVVSWCLLRGKCRSCHSPIPLRYPAIELATGAACFVAGLRYQAPLALFGMMLAIFTTVTLSATDLDQRLIPKRIVYGGFCLVAIPLTLSIPWGMGLSPELTVKDLTNAVVSGAVVGLFFFVTHMLSPKGLRFGDVRMAALVGFILGWVSPLTAVLGILVALGAAVVVGAVLAIHRRSTKVALPLAPFLATGATVGILFGPTVAQLSIPLGR